LTHFRWQVFFRIREWSFPSCFMYVGECWSRNKECRASCLCVFFLTLPRSAFCAAKGNHHQRTIFGVLEWCECKEQGGIRTAAYSDTQGSDPPAATKQSRRSRTPKTRKASGDHPLKPFYSRCANKRKNYALFIATPVPINSKR